MADLRDYVQDLKNQGYEDDYIRNYLKQYGYDEEDINRVMGGDGMTVRHEHHVSKGALVFLILFMIVGAGTVFAVLKLTGVLGSEALLDFEAVPQASVVKADGEVPFTLKITNLGSKERFDVTVTYRILDQYGDQVSSREETFAVSTSVTRDKTIPAPSVPGEYTLEAVGSYDGKEAKGSFTFTVAGTQEEEEEEEPAQEEEPESEPEEQAEEEDSQEVQAVIEEVKELAGSLPAQAEKKCLQLTGADRDDCLSLVVKESERPEFCKNMNSDETRDNCYMSFIVDGQTHLCRNVVLKSSQDYCKRIRDVEMLSKYYQEN